MCPCYVLEHLLGIWYLLGIAASLGSTMCNFLRNCQTNFQSVCISLQSHQQWRNVLLSPHLCQNWLITAFLILAILTIVGWNLRFVLICISLMTKDVENFFRCFLAIRVYSVENSVQFYSPFSIGLFGSLESNFLRYIYILIYIGY